MKINYRHKEYKFNVKKKSHLQIKKNLRISEKAISSIATEPIVNIALSQSTHPVRENILC